MFVNDSQRILLELLLGGVNQAEDHWKKWITHSNWLEKPVDPDSLHLLPMVYQESLKGKMVLQDLPRLKGVYKRAWFEASRLLHEAHPVFNELRIAGIPVMLLDQMALRLTSNPDWGPSPIRELQFAVPESSANEALSIMLDKKWKYQRRGSPISERATCFHAFGLANSEGGRVRVHRYLRPENQKAEDDLPVWKRALPTDFDGLEVFVPIPTDAFLLTLLVGWRDRRSPSVAWIWDAHILLNTKSSRIDWDLLAIESQRRQVSLGIHSALQYLRKSWNFSIPPSIMNHLLEFSHSKFELWEGKILSSKSPFMISFIQRAFINYSRKKGKPTSLNWWRGYINYMFCLTNPPDGLKAVPWIIGRIWDKIFVY